MGIERSHPSVFLSEMGRLEGRFLQLFERGSVANSRKTETGAHHSAAWDVSVCSGSCRL